MKPTRQVKAGRPTRLAWCDSKVPHPFPGMLKWQGARLFNERL